MLTREQMIEAVNTDDLSAEIQNAFSDGEGQLRERHLTKLIEWIVDEILASPTRCPTCEATEAEGHVAHCPDGPDPAEHEGELES